MATADEPDYSEGNEPHDFDIGSGYEEGQRFEVSNIVNGGQILLGDYQKKAKRSMEIMVATWNMLGWQGVDINGVMQRTEECIKAAQYIVHGQDGAAGTCRTRACPGSPLLPSNTSGHSIIWFRLMVTSTALLRL